jgi:hypothetical protein
MSDRHSLSDELDRLEQRARRTWFEQHAGREQWFVATTHEVDESHMGWLWSYLVPAAEAPEQLKKPGYGEVPKTFEPAFVGAEEAPIYARLGTSDSYEPLVHHRSWHGVRPSELDVSEEYRHFHNLFRDLSGDLALVAKGGAHDEVVIRFREPAVEFRLAELRQFLAAKQMALIACIDWREFSKRTLAELGLRRGEGERRGSTFITMLGYGSSNGTAFEAFSRLLGKSVIAPPPVEESGRWPTEVRDNEFPAFIIDSDTNGRPVEYSCDPDGLSTYFDVAPTAPHYLTPVHFRREVLQRYYSKPDRFFVEDGMLRCGRLWSIQIDNDHPKHLVVYLGDLGRDLPSSERPHWKLHNVAPDYGPESETSFRRNRLAQWTEPKSPDLLIGPRLRQVNETWSTRFGWPLFPELGMADAHSRQRLHIPLDESDVEFDEQVRVLSKLTIESIDGRVSSLGTHQANARPIQRLAVALATIGGSPSDIQTHVITPFNDLNDLNNGVRHRRGARWKRVAERLRLDVTPKTVVFGDLLVRVLRALDYIDSLTTRSSTV